MGWITYSIYLLKVNKKTIEKGVKYVQSQQKRHQNNVSNIFLMSLLLTLNIFYTFYVYQDVALNLFKVRVKDIRKGIVWER